MPLTSPKNCHCGQPQPFNQCCQPLLAGTQTAISAEQLMRSRYSAYVEADIDYLLATWAPAVRTGLDREAIAHWAQASEWLGLTILSTGAGQAEDTTGTVMFMARYRQNGKVIEHQELSSFIQEQGRWYYLAAL